MNKPITAAAYLLHTADMCASQVCQLVECHDAAGHHALCQTLAAGLTALKLACDADIQSSPVAETTRRYFRSGDQFFQSSSDAETTLPLSLEAYWPDNSLTLEYCEALVKVLSVDALPREVIQPLTGLLHDLVNMLADQWKEELKTTDAGGNHE
ncbi:hypothetical protein FQG48_02585 [Escherichia coli]|nr:hypothetical protein [Escherichia coli]EFH6066156.1 hypothetical protein [Escherichia coli]EFN3809297.1 hypothetical protein [Escherichia coli]EFN4946230.1 hypothetical protein [Escherichia coli]EFN5640117.1 hypothetical protein [Escherichia coli]